MRNGVSTPISGRKPRAVLAMLLLNANRVVSCERLQDGLWGGRHPRNAMNALQVFVSRVRSALGEREINDDQRMLVTAAGGYMIRLDPESIDLCRFERLVHEGRVAHAHGNAAAAGRLIGEALDLWNGDPIVDVCDEPFAVSEALRLEELRLSAQEARLAAELDAGRQAEITPDLEAMVERYPQREHIAELCMIALYRCGRQLDALATYETHRTQLVDSHGLEPGPALRELQRRILTQDTTLLGVTERTKPHAHPDELLASRYDARAQSRRTAPSARGWRWFRNGSNAWTCVR
jgi:DNA-binding SARP family transcriptional activator